MGEVQKSRVTLLDIAADADVSRSTVSLVIRNVPSVAETTPKTGSTVRKKTWVMFIIAAPPVCGGNTPTPSGLLYQTLPIHLGRKPGVDFGIVGFNNIPDAAQCVPALTTIDNSPRQLSEAAAKLLLKRIEQRTAPIRTLVLQPQLIVRESCGTNFRSRRPSMSKIKLR
jgi:Periplasmic binding protein-like domain/Bacterial regulatory proteins, lacI family